MGYYMCKIIEPRVMSLYELKGLLEELSKHDFPALNNCTLYIVSSSINPVDIERSKHFNLVKDFIVKPIGPNELIEIFSEAPTAP